MESDVSYHITWQLAEHQPCASCSDSVYTMTSMIYFDEVVKSALNEIN